MFSEKKFFLASEIPLELRRSVSRVVYQQPNHTKLPGDCKTDLLPGCYQTNPEVKSDWTNLHHTSWRSLDFSCSDWLVLSHMFFVGRRVTGTSWTENLHKGWSQWKRRVLGVDEDEIWFDLLPCLLLLLSFQASTGAHGHPRQPTLEDRPQQGGQIRTCLWQLHPRPGPMCSACSQQVNSPRRYLQPLRDGPPMQKGPELANTLCTHHYEKKENRGENF